MGGPLEGVRVLEVAGLGPAPFCGMLLADLGADVVSIDRADRAVGADPATAAWNVYGRGRRSVGVDLKHPDGVEVVLRLAEDADVFIEGFRPGVAERLGIGPDEVLGRNPRVVYGRMTGWGQTGPMADRAGHDINYVAVAGPLAHIGRAGQPPTPPLNLVGDFGGGGLLLAFGICAALVERERSGEGQVIDAAMVDGAALLSAAMVPAYALGYLNEERGTNWVDSGAHYYEAYECADGTWISVGAIEEKFYVNLLAGLGLADEELPAQDDQSAWPEMKERFASIFATETRDHWLEVFAGIDNCVSPVNRFVDVLDDEHLAARGTYVALDGVLQPSPAPRFSRTPAALDRPPAVAGQHTDEVLAAAGLSADDIMALRTSGGVA
jgi:alpha-methylacyl-CoA racemase